MSALVIPIALTGYTALSVLRAQDGLSNAQLARRSLVTPQSMSEVLALLVVLETLAPAERVAFVLHDVFAVDDHLAGRRLDEAADAPHERRLP